MGSSQSKSGHTADGPPEGTDKRPQSFYQRYQEKKRGPGLSEEEIKKYTGKSRDELKTWADGTPGVGKNQLAGSATAGPTSGLAGMAMADGLGGWGPGAAPSGENRGLKFPPTKAQADEDESVDKVEVRVEDKDAGAIAGR
jgi:hypothetical protein